MHKISLSSLHGLNLWLAWNLFTYLGLIISLIILYSTGPYRVTFPFGPEKKVLVFLISAISGLLTGIVTGSFQSLIVGSKINDKGRWIIATAIGWALWGSVDSLSRMPVSSTYYHIVEKINSFAPYLVGTVVGIAQWLVLRQHVQKAVWWIVANTLGWVTPIAILSILGLTDINILAIILTVLIVPGVFTGIALLYLFENSEGMYARISAVVAILLLLAGVVLSTRPEVRLQACWLFSNGGGQILHSISSPDGSMVINVVKVDCGQSDFYDGVFYDCSTRIDLQQNDDPARRGYDWNGECDLNVEWLDNANIEVTESSGEKTIVDVYEFFGILP